MASLGLLGAALVMAPMVFVRTPYNTGQYFAVNQPVEFDHRHHVRDVGIDCLYCHSSAETSASAGIPSTEVCMGCHNQIWTDSPLLHPVQASYFDQRPIPWRRVHELADFVYFDHSVHIQRGIGCARCHGRVDEMALVYPVVPLTMQWCLDCHSDPISGAMEFPPAPPGLGDTFVETASRSFLGDAELSRGPRHTFTDLRNCTACHR